MTTGEMGGAVIPGDWFGLYAGTWNGDIVPAAYAHPAKFSRLLIARIYDYAIGQGYLRPGDSVVDCFGGVALGALDAIKHGIDWTGVELESNFVELGNQNIALWNERYGRYNAMMGKPYGTARLIQGDSRRLTELVGVKAEMCVSSPHYASELIRKREAGNSTPGRQGSTLSGGHVFDEYGTTAGQLGSMPEGSFTAAISSPPYADAVAGNGEGPGARHDPIYHNGDNAYKKSNGNEYGRTPGNLGNMSNLPETAAFEEVVQDAAVRRLRWEASPEGQAAMARWNAEDNAPGNPGNYAAAVSSPPFEASINIAMEKVSRAEYSEANGIGNTEFVTPIDLKRARGKVFDSYGADPGNIGNDQGDNFWTAARLIVEQVYTVLRPGGVAIWVCGDFVRDKKRVYFGRQWQELCQAVGFVPVEWITAHKSEPQGVQYDIEGNPVQLTIDRVSFFRRLANQNNPDAAILNEDVIIMRKECQ